MLNKKDQKTRKRKPNMYQPVVGYSHTMQIERDKEAWQAISDSLPANAFADRLNKDCCIKCHTFLDGALQCPTCKLVYGNINEKT